MTIPKELIDQWAFEITEYTSNNQEICEYVAQKAADYEFQKCLDWFKQFYSLETWMERDAKEFKKARRPETVKEKAIKSLQKVKGSPQDIKNLTEAIYSI